MHVTVFVDPSYDSQNGPPDGSFERPLLTLQAAVALTATSRILTIQLSDAVYTVLPDEPLIIKGNCTIRAPNGPSKVVITCRSALRCAMFQADGTAMHNLAELLNSTYSWWVILEGLTLDQPGVDTLNAVAPSNEPASLGVTGMLLAGMGRSFVTAYVNVTLRNCEFANQAVGVNALALTHGVAVLEDVVFRNNTAWTPTAGLPTTGAAVHVRNVNSVRMQNVWVMIYLFHIYMLCDCYTVIVSLAAVYSHIYHMT